jgi:alpha-2-macroglobulin
MNILCARILQIAVALLAISAGGATAQSAIASNATQVEDFSPQGYVKAVRQVTARFSAPMVALGDPRLDDPFAIDCAQAGKGRWADGRPTDSPTRDH